ncbi:VOC family protein [Variovorax paradoxus]|jgi:PhnB protein|uniref:VOC family protein n=1 Tax=Variovorax paradoxus TaxID=34073 RepID=UPI002784C87F|nr:VOC family protein [Variovorax paradoxus]MDP9933233.1 PhnB protein [Variovorax paradoxus]
MQAYLTFNGNAAEAMAFYAKALDGKVIFSMTFGESPMGAETPAEHKNKIMHAALEARGHKLMASDMPPGMPFEGHKGFSLSVQANSVEEGKKLFDALAQGGQITMPYGPQFWAVGFGMLTDKFGVPWMVNCEK